MADAAFPKLPHEAYVAYKDGSIVVLPVASLRDWFAGMAMQGMLANLGAKLVSAEMAYHMADAMLKEREK